MLPLILVMLAGQSAASSVPLDTHPAKTQAYVRCTAPTGNDITVCGRRNADHYRVPLVEHDAGDPEHESVAAERERLQAKTNNCEEKSTFLVGCGAAGVSATAGFGPDGVSPPTVRPLAP